MNSVTMDFLILGSICKLPFKAVSSKYLALSNTGRHSLFLKLKTEVKFVSHMQV